jgi:hypothetical protein
MHEPRLNLYCPAVRAALDSDRILRADRISLHRFTDWDGWMACQLGEQVGEPAPVAPADTSAHVYVTETGHLYAAVWAGDDVVAVFPPAMLGQGSECCVGPLPLRLEVSNV